MKNNYTFKIVSLNSLNPKQIEVKIKETVIQQGNSKAVKQDSKIIRKLIFMDDQVWKREGSGKSVRHVLAQTLLSQECAIMALVVNAAGTVVYYGSSDRMVNFWLCEKEFSHSGVMKGHKLAVLYLAVANLVFNGSANKAICVWRQKGSVHTCLPVLSGHIGQLKYLAVEENKEPATTAGDKKWVVYSGCLDKSVKV